ncbi:response regulator transcription factor [Cryptosporangium phraense]|uniref:Response regulator transcription factor n=1 Tax=Cryptosporangium phraense TaxID=2593070 RepID=A0A545B012_9ACTN|nr:response regulator transcription factor [Cryptosporangium phraense]TQS46898.1 response regulator transcription factor [Cryptosporangium phraense]
MTPETPGPDRIPVSVHGDDPLIVAGLVHFLTSSPLVELCEADGGVAVLFAERVDRPVMSRLRALGRTGRVVLVVPRVREPELLRALDGGVSVILLRHQVTPEGLLDAVRTAAGHDRALPRDAVDQLVDVVLRLRREAGARVSAHPPTDRELDVLRLLADGLETREIAERLEFSERTVKNVLHGVTSRFRLRNRTHAVAHAIREGYL